MNKLNRMRPRINPCGTPEMISFRIHKTFHFDCLLTIGKVRVNQLECVSVQTISFKFASSKSCGRQSKAFDKSINTAPATLLSLSNLNDNKVAGAVLMDLERRTFFQLTFFL